MNIYSHVFERYKRLGSHYLKLLYPHNLEIYCSKSADKWTRKTTIIDEKFQNIFFSSYLIFFHHAQQKSLLHPQYNVKVKVK